VTASVTERKLAAIMFTDMVGYSALAQRNEALALELLGEHQRLLRPIFRAHGGHEIKAIGDGFLVELGSALQAIRCAIAIQVALAERNASAASERSIRVRIGLHLGDVEARDGDVFGDGVNIAARIEPLAEPGGICISGAMFEQVRNKIAEPLVRLGKPELKNIEMPIDVYRVAVSGTEGSAVPDGASTGARKRLATVALLVAFLFVAGITLLRHQETTETAPRAARSATTPIPPVQAEGRKSIAVLPFVNMSSDKENEYFSDGITEDLINALSKVSGLHVAARTSSFAFKGKNEDVRTIGARLQVGAILEGSVAKAGDKVRITAQLINTADGYHLWSDNYDRELKDIFAIRSEVAETVAKALQVTLDARERQTLERKPTEDLEAYQLYLKGRHATASLNDWDTAIRYLQQAVARDPSYALPYLGLADYYTWAIDWALSPLEACPRAREAAEKALALDPSLAEAHVFLATERYMCAFDYEGARHDFETALALQPELSSAHEWYGYYLVATGETEKGLAEARKAVELDPLSAHTSTMLGMNLFFAGQNDAAAKALRTAIAIDPDAWWAREYLARAYARDGKFSEAIAELQRGQQSSTNPEIESVLGRVYADSGDRAAATKVLDHLRERAHNEFIAPAYIATILIGLGQTDEAFAALAEAAEQRSWYVTLWKIDPDLDPLRGDPRFAALLEKVGLKR
jgi:TolB-like protein/class 3 adenylate cyclase/Flp pilus assembly protein TadD